MYREPIKPTVETWKDSSGIEHSTIRHKTDQAVTLEVKLTPWNRVKVLFGWNPIIEYIAMGNNELSITLKDIRR